MARLTIVVTSNDSFNGLSAGMARGYGANQDDFNQLQLDDIVSYEVTHDDKNVIVGFDEINGILA